MTIAGEVGVAITQSMLRHSWLIEEEPWYRLTRQGRAVFTDLGIEIGDGRTCMDWSERRLHLAGPLGRHLAHNILERDWLRRAAKSRPLWLTPLGAERLSRIFDVIFRNGSSNDP